MTDRPTNTQPAAPTDMVLSSTFGPLALLLSLPPAITLLGNLSLMMFIGPIADWLQEFWYPLTRRIWEIAFSFLGVLNLSDALKDYLTAIVFFLPAYLMCRRRTVTKGRKSWFWLLAGFLAALMASILARNLETDGNLIVSALLVWVFLPSWILAWIWTAWVMTAMEKEDIGLRVHNKTEKPAPPKIWLLMRWGPPVALVLMGAAIVCDLAVMTVNPFPPIIDNDVSFFMGDAPRRAWIGLAMMMLLIWFPFIIYVRPENTQRAKAARKDKAAPKNKRKLFYDRVVTAIIALFLIATVISVLITVGPAETLALAILAFILINIVIRTPHRIFGIAATMALILGSSYVVWGITEGRALLEGMI